MPLFVPEAKRHPGESQDLVDLVLAFCPKIPASAGMTW